MKIILLLFLTTHFCSAQQKNENYLNYHSRINQAEDLYFNSKNTDSALLCYNEVFNDFDFIFLKDILNAAQIAVHEKKEYRSFLELAFKFGLKKEHFKQYPILKKVTDRLLKDISFRKKIKKNRELYLSKIDLKYLSFIYKSAIEDQNQKALNNYEDLIYNRTQNLVDTIIKKGFPGERLLGIDNSTIFTEIGKPYFDLSERVKKHKNLSYMKSGDLLLSQKWIYVILVHNPCSYSLYQNILVEQIKKGNIHPRDIGMLHDNAFRFIKFQPSYCKNISVKEYFLLNLFTNYPEKVNRNKTNQLRKSNLIVSLEIDEIKKEYEAKFGFKLFSGFWNCR